MTRTRNDRSRRPARLALAFGAAVAALVSVGGAQAAPRGGTVSVIVRERTPATPAAEQAVLRLGGRVTRELSLVGGFAATLPASRQAALRRDASVRSVSTDAAVRMKSGSSDCDGSDPNCYDHLPPIAWQGAIGLDTVPHRYQGDGLTVALLDTGVTPSPDLGVRLLERVDLTAEHDGIDHFGHGTHMSGLIAGNGTQSAEAFEGSAPETNLVSIKVAGWDGATDVSTVIAGLQWAVSHRVEYDIRVLNLSFGTDAKAPYAGDPLDYAVERAWRAGIVVVVAAGNDGAAPNSTISKPGDDPLVLTVGAADVAGTATTADDVVAPFSSRGPTQDALAKPDVLAPGVSLVSLRAPGSTVDTFRPLAREGDVYFRGSGTSQAAAIVSGVVARMLEANPLLTPNQVKQVLSDTADATLSGPAGGAGLINAAAAVATVAPVKGGGATAATTTRSTVPAAANRAVPFANGLGSIQDSRGTHLVFGDVDGDGLPDEISGEVDVFGNPWVPAAFVGAAWSPAGWNRSPWSNVTAELPGDAPAPPWTGGDLPPLAWQAKYWGASSWRDAGWTAKYWGAKYWGAKYWGSGMWQ